MQDILKYKEKSLVSIIVPAYNTEKYIEKCLFSLQKQTYENCEILILNDGSEDTTAIIANRFQKKDSRFHVISKKNSGVSDTRNLGIEIAQGKYVIFVDSDDYVTDDYVQTLVETLEKTDVQLVCANFFLVVNEKVKGNTQLKNDVEILKASEAIDMMADRDKYQGYLWNKIFKKEVLDNKNIRFDKTIKIWEDMLFCLKYMNHIDKVAYVKKSIYYYNVRENSAMTNKKIWNEYTQLKAIDEMWNLVQPYEGKFKKVIRDHYVENLVGMLGKEVCYSRQECKTAIAKVDELGGNLSLKHKIKLMVFKKFPVIAQMVFSVNKEHTKR